MRRFYQERGLDRRRTGAAGGGKMRLRWQAGRPTALWQGDVCHGSPLVVGEQSTTVRVHALLDDASRYIVAVEAMAQEREVDMLAPLVRVVEPHPHRHDVRARPASPSRMPMPA